MTTKQGSIESDAKALQDGLTEVDLWLKKIEKARDLQKDWRREAAESIGVYEGAEKYRHSLNLWHSTVETIVPALYNSTPVPSAKRRYGDKDRIARLAAEMIERAISYEIDQFAFDDHMLDSVRDEWLAGRGTDRIRYEALNAVRVSSAGKEYQEIDKQRTYMEPVRWDRWGHGPGQHWEDIEWVWFDHDLTRDAVEALMMPDPPEIEEFPEPESPDTSNIDDPGVVAQIEGAHLETVMAARAEHEARQQEIEKAHQEAVKKVQERLNDLSFSTTGREAPAGGTKEEPEKGLMQTIPVIEVWCKKSRSVYFITEKDREFALATFDDPLGLSQFFPLPRPICTVRKASALAPVVPYTIAKDLFDEANRITIRIRKLVHQLKVRGLISADYADDMDVLSRLEDGQYHPAGKTGAMNASTAGGTMADAIFHQPMEPTVVALKQLYEQRTEVKQLIYEVLGIADILRGSTNPHETLGAQQIKASWGSQRVQRQQGDIARFARDVFRMFAEIIASKYEWDYLKQITGMDFAPEPVSPEDVEMPPQMGHNGGPALDDMDPEQMQVLQQEAVQKAMEVKQQEAAETEKAVEELLRSQLFSFKIDIETDSTIRADLLRDQEQMNNFLNGTAQFWSAAIPAIQVVPKFMPHFTELYALFTTKFRLGKQSEDILERMVQAAEEAAQQPLPGSEGPSPEEAEAAKAESEAKVAISKNKIEESREKTRATKIKAAAEVHKANAGIEQQRIAAASAPMLSGNGVDPGTMQ